jgi:hypothetical protein
MGFIAKIGSRGRSPHRKLKLHHHRNFLRFAVTGLNCPMEVSGKIQCPFCGQAFDLVVDTSVPSQRFTTDCEVCCHPFDVVAECEPGEILSLDVATS